MAEKTFFLISLLYITTANAAILRHEDAPRIARSPHFESCDESPPPLSPPEITGIGYQSPHFHTQQWSGLIHSPDGSQQQIFSGAAVSAEPGLQKTSDSQAFSIASSSTGSGQPQGRKDNKHSTSGDNGDGKIEVENLQLQEKLDDNKSWKELQKEHPGNNNPGQAAAESSSQSPSGNDDSQKQLQLVSSRNKLSTGEHSGDYASSNNAGAYDLGNEQQQVQFDKSRVGNHFEGIERSSTHDGASINKEDDNDNIQHSQYKKNDHFTPSKQAGGFTDGKAKEIPEKYYGNEQEQHQQWDNGQLTASGRGDIGIEHQNRNYHAGRSYEASSSSFSGDDGNEQRQIHYGGPRHLYTEENQQQQMQFPGKSYSNLAYTANEQQQRHKSSLRNEGNYGKSLQQELDEDNEQQIQQLPTFDHHTSKSVYGKADGTSYDNVQADLSGALSVASQGLKASQDLQIPQQPMTACSTCEGKGTLAYSNAKSNSGSAIALSINGK